MDSTATVRMYAPAVYALCLAMVRDRARAEDLAQETFVRAFTVLGEATPRVRLLEIALQGCLAHAKPAPADTGWDDAVVEPPAPYDILSNRDEAARALAALHEHDGALVVLHYGHGVGFPELADAFGLAHGAIRARVSRALVKMRAVLRADRLEATGDDAASVDQVVQARREPAPVLFPALYEEPSPSLWSRLEALRILRR